MVTPPDSVRLLTSSESDEDNDLQLTQHNRGRQLSQGKEYLVMSPICATVDQQ